MGGLVRKFACVLFVCVAFCANARVLHVGDNTIKLSQTKTTDPALHVRVGDELWYANMGRCQLPMNENTDKELKVRYNDTDYWVSEAGDYVIKDGKLIAANCNVYLESTGTQWIDTGFIANQDTRIVAYAQAATRAIAFFGSRTSPGKDAFYFLCTDTDDYRTDYGSYAIYLQRCKHNQKLLIDKNKNITTLTYEDLTTYTNTVTYHQFTTPVSIGIFALNYPAGIDLTPVGVIFYYIKIWDNDVLVRHFVPVPWGLQIGDFVVPSNGMWDIVEQKFYGNMGTGDFIYGVDE